MHLLSTRPEADEGGDPLHTALLEAGHRVSHAPLLSIRLSGELPALAGVQALIVTSRNALKAVARAPLPESALALPLFAVGPATADLARALGFRRVVEGPGTGRELAPLIAEATTPTAGALVHLAGDTRAFDFKQALERAGYEVRVAVVYHTAPAEAFPPEIVEALRAGQFDGVVLMSPRTARVYATLVRHASLEAAVRPLAHFCLSEAVAREVAALTAAEPAVARSPNSEEMLALIAREASDFP